jgi:hypothetical protein
MADQSMKKYFMTSLVFLSGYVSAFGAEYTEAKWKNELFKLCQSKGGVPYYDNRSPRHFVECLMPRPNGHLFIATHNEYMGGAE